MKKLLIATLLLCGGGMAETIPEDQLQLIDPRDPKLKQTAYFVTNEELNSGRFQIFLDDMIRFARGEQGDANRTVLVGLAAPQVGVMKRVILVDSGADGKGKVGGLKVYVNPEILEYSLDEEKWYEGCFSTGKVAGIVSRPRKVKIQALDRKGNVIIEVHQGYIARIFQHEIDHLNGIRFPARVSKEEDLHVVEPHEFPKYRNQEGWRTWEKKCSWDEWLHISGSG